MLKQLDYRITTICNCNRTKERQSQFVAQLHRLLVSYGSFNFSLFVYLFCCNQVKINRTLGIGLSSLLATFLCTKANKKGVRCQKFVCISRVVVRHMIS